VASGELAHSPVTWYEAAAAPMNAAPIAISGVFHFAGFMETSAECRPTANIYRKQPQKAASFKDVPDVDTVACNGGATRTWIVFE
jgi:hypothetical protein